MLVLEHHQMEWVVFHFLSIRFYIRLWVFDAILSVIAQNSFQVLEIQQLAIGLENFVKVFHMAFQYVSLTDKLSVKLLFDLLMRIIFGHFPDSYVIGSIIDFVFVVFLKLVKDLFLLNFRLILVEVCFFYLLLLEELLVFVFQKEVEDVGSFIKMKVFVNEW